jgi:putative membrane protein
VNFVVKTLVNAGALGVAIWLFEGITLTGADRSDRALSLLLVAAIFGLVNAVVGTVLKVLSLPLIILSLGLMSLVINAALLLLTSKISDSLDLGFTVDGFWTALLGSIVISLSSMILNVITPSDK